MKVAWFVALMLLVLGTAAVAQDQLPPEVPDITGPINRIGENVIVVADRVFAVDSEVELTTSSGVRVPWARMNVGQSVMVFAGDAGEQGTPPMARRIVLIGGL